MPTGDFPDPEGMFWTDALGWVPKDPKPLFVTEPPRPPGEERDYLGMYGGIAIYCNPNLAPGVVQLRNPDGEILATIHNVKQVDSRGRWSAA